MKLWRCLSYKKTEKEKRTIAKFPTTKLIAIGLIAASTLYSIACLAFYFGQESILFPAKQIDEKMVFDFPLKHEEIYIDTPDGARLNGVLFLAENPSGVILHFHGNGENVLHMKYAAEPFVARGYSFLAMDYRSYGKSTGELSEKILFSDALLSWQYLTDRDWQPSDIILYGRSIGTSIATQLASEQSPRGMILYSPFYSLQSLVSEKAPFLPVSSILKYPLDSATYMQKVNCPVLILHGDSDPVIPISSAERLAQVRGKLVVLSGGNHENLANYPEFWLETDHFLQGMIQEL